MMIKKYIGKNEEEALAEAKKDLGPGVVALNCKKIPGRGIWRILGRTQVEVTAAIEETDTARGRTRLEEKLDSLQNLLIRRMEEGGEGGSGGKGPGEDAAYQTPAPSDACHEPEEVDRESHFIKLLYNTMIDNEVDERYANQVMEDVERLEKAGSSMDHTLEGIYQKLILKFGRTAGIMPADHGPRVVVLIGPTGVGKTTTIAKIASQFAIDLHKKVALFSSDTYRISATDQLRTYANILEVPFRVIYTPEELLEGIEYFSDYDYIFVDTTGHSHNNEAQLEYTRQIVDIMGENIEKQIFLVLSATSKQKDLMKIADNYKRITDYQLIFTKLDETEALGNILNIKFHTGASIAYVTQGQDVPDDIEPFNPQKTVKILLGGGKK